MTTTPVVPWILGTRLALARALALVIAEERKVNWGRLSPAQRDRLVADAEARVQRWVSEGAARTFLAEWREPLVETHADEADRDEAVDEADGEAEREG